MWVGLEGLHGSDQVKIYGQPVLADGVEQRRELSKRALRMRAGGLEERLQFHRAVTEGDGGEGFRGGRRGHVRFSRWNAGAEVSRASKGALAGARSSPLPRGRTTHWRSRHRELTLQEVNFHVWPGIPDWADYVLEGASRIREHIIIGHQLQPRHTILDSYKLSP